LPSDTRFSLAAAVNNRAVLANCLERSPDVASGALRLRIYEGARSASAAYNQAISEAEADILILAHQDVYLPEGFLARLGRELARLNGIDPEWALAGVAGLDPNGQFQGRTWSTGLGIVLGQPPATPTRVVTLDEMLIILRVSSGVRFDEALPGFHLYAADAVQAAGERRQASYVIDTPAIHHSRPVVQLDDGYKRAYRYMQSKWRRALPIPNLVCPITRSPLTLWLRDARMRRKHRGKARPEEPTDNPALIAERLGFVERSAP
jgi:hypothetical protein